MRSGIKYRHFEPRLGRIRGDLIRIVFIKLACAGQLCARSPAMLLRLSIFDRFIDDIERRLRRRLPARERKACELMRLCRVVDGHTGLRESFPRDLQRVLRIVEYGLEDAWADSEAARAQLRAFAGPAPPAAAGQAPQVPEAADAVIERALRVACPLIKEAFDLFMMRKIGVLEENSFMKKRVDM